MKITLDNIKADLIPENEQERTVCNSIANAHAVMAPGALYMRAYQVWKKTKGKAGWDGRVRLIQKSVMTGIVPYVIDKLKGQVSRIEVVDNRTSISKVLSNTSVPLKDYQKEAVDAAINNKENGLWWPRGILEIATGGGKTEVAVAMYQIMPVPTLFLVHRKHLLKQAKDRFLKYGIQSGQVGDGVLDLHPNLNIATIQTIESKLRRGESMGWLNDVQQVFFDEAHSIAASVAKGNSFVNVSNMLPNAYFRWGLTATPFMKDEYSNWLLMGATGKSLYSISNATLIEKGHLTPPEIIMVEAPKVTCPNSWPDCYNSGIVLNTGRTQLIIDWIKKIDKPCLILCTQIAHAEIISYNASLQGIHVPVLKGGDSSETRANVIKDLREGRLDQVVCTSIFNEGVDIPELRGLILAAGGKSKVSQLQKLGRGLRRAEKKDRVVVVDFSDTSSKILIRHSKERKKIWEEQGFEIKLNANLK